MKISNAIDEILQIHVTSDLTDDRFEKRESKRLSRDVGMAGLKWDKSNSKEVIQPSYLKCMSLAFHFVGIDLICNGKKCVKVSSCCCC